MAVLAVQHIRRMRGGAQGQLMLGADGHAYVVKFQNNPQHRRVLANEFLATRLARAAGLTAPEVELVDVSKWLIDNTAELEIDLGRARVKCEPGLQFGSRFVGGLMPGQVVDYLPEEQLLEVMNLAEFAGILALDKWTGNANGRQAVFARRRRERRYQAVFIDFGYCFHAGEWRFEARGNRVDVGRIRGEREIQAGDFGVDAEAFKDFDCDFGAAGFEDRIERFEPLGNLVLIHVVGHYVCIVFHNSRRVPFVFLMARGRGARNLCSL